MPSDTRSWFKDILVLTLLISVLYGLFLGTRPLAPPDEGRYSEIPREMVVSGDYITPYLNGTKYFEKPALFYWLQAISIKAFGVNQVSLRLVTALMGVIGCLLTYWGARKLYGRRTALLSAIILGSSILYAGLAHFIILDTTLSTFLTGSFLFFLVGNQYPTGKKRADYFWLMYAFAAFATLTKGLIGILFPGMVILAWIALTNQWRQLRSYYLFSGSCLFLAITLPWHILVQLKNPEFFHFYFYEQHFLRYLTDYADRKQPIWFLPSVLVLGFFPWTGFLLSALKKQLLSLKNLLSAKNEIFLLLWAGLIFFFYWCSHSQLIPYILPIFAPLAIITGKYINDYGWKEGRLLNFGFLTATVMSFCVSIALLIFIHHKAIAPLSAYAIALLPILLVIINLNYWKKNTPLSILLLTTSSAFLVIFGTFYYELFESRSAKPVAIKLLKYMKNEDTVYNFNHYYQDLPVYLGRKVKVVNWTGELKFGIDHSKSDLYLDENQLRKEWPNPSRKFMVLKKEDVEYLKNALNLNVFTIAVDHKYALICNQEINH